MSLLIRRLFISSSCSNNAFVLRCLHVIPAAFNKAKTHVNTHSHNHTHSNLISEVINDYGAIKSPVDWFNLKARLFEKSRFINETNFDAVFLQYCTANEKFELAEMFFDYLKTIYKDKEISLGVLGKFFRIYFFMNEAGFKSKMKEEDILNLYCGLRKKYQILDSVSGELAICGLSLTKNWKECVKLLEEIKVTSVPSTEAYSLTACAAFKHNEDSLGFKLMEEMFLNNRIPQTRTYLTFLKSENVKKKLENLLYFLETHDVICNREIVDNLMQIKDLKISKSLISPKGDCSNCRRRLQRLNITNNEFLTLKEAFMKKALIGNNIFTKTTPKELERFKEFIAVNQKFTVVIDGLNVAYRMGKGNPQIASKTIMAVINYFNNKKQAEGGNLKVLLFGRKHMEKWPKFLSTITRNGASYFLTENLSYDDPFLIYAAMNSGLKTKIITNDLMRSHLFLLEDIKLKRLFTKWLVSNQHSLLRIDKFGQPVFQLPSPYLKVCQKEDKYWHIPCSNNNGNNNNNETDNEIKEWLCLKLT